MLCLCLHAGNVIRMLRLCSYAGECDKVVVSVLTCLEFD